MAQTLQSLPDDLQVGDFRFIRDENFAAELVMKTGSSPGSFAFVTVSGPVKAFEANVAEHGIVE